MCFCKLISVCWPSRNPAERRQWEMCCFFKKQSRRAREMIGDDVIVLGNVTDAKCEYVCGQYIGVWLLIYISSYMLFYVIVAFFFLFLKGVREWVYMSVLLLLCMSEMFYILFGEDQVNQTPTFLGLVRVTVSMWVFKSFTHYRPVLFQRSRCTTQNDFGTLNMWTPTSLKGVNISINFIFININAKKQSSYATSFDDISI